MRGVSLALQHSQQQLAESQRLQARYLDDESNVELSSRFAKETAEDGNAIAIIGAVNTGCTQEVVKALRSEQSELQVVSPIASHSGLNGEQILRMGPNDRQSVHDLVNHVLALPGHAETPKFVSVYANDCWSRGLDSDLQEACEGNRCQTVSLCLNGGATNDTCHKENLECYDAAGIVEQIAKQDPVPFAVALFCPGCGRLVTSLREKGLPLHFFSTTANATRAITDATNDEEKEGVIIGTSFGSAGSTSPVATRFKQDFSKYFPQSSGRYADERPDNYAAQAYDATLLIVEAFAKLQSEGVPVPAMRAQLRSTIEHVAKARRLEGVLGCISIVNNERGLVTPIKKWGYDAAGKMALLPDDMYVRLVDPWEARRAGVLFGLFAVAGFFALAIIRHPLVGRWFPMVFVLCSWFGARKMLTPDWWPKHFDPFSFWVSLVTGMLAVFAAVLIWRMDRSIVCRPEPFRTLLYPALKWPLLRKYVYQQLLSETGDKIRYERERVITERYVELPVALTVVHRDSKRCRTETETSPAQRLITELRQAHELAPPRILIEAPGGQGKSALLREVVSQLICTLRSDQSMPIPLLCVGTEKSVEDMVRIALGRFYIDEALTQWHLRNGHFLIVLDGFSEAQLSDQEITRFLESDEGRYTALLISTRVRPELRQALQLTGWTLGCEPERLDDASLALFLKSYDAEITPNLKKACAAGDGRYLQILIRLAMWSPAARSVAELYRSALMRLTRRDEQLLEEAGQFCLETYWRTGTRMLPFGHANRTQRRLLERLLDAGVLISDTENAKTDEPSYVKFCHDAIQTYLTAKALEVEQTMFTLLERCIGDKIFQEASPHDDSIEHSDLFDMCLLLVVDTRRVRAWLARRARELAKKYGGELPSNNVLRALPQSVASTVKDKVMEGSVLELVDLALLEDDGDTEPRPLPESIAARVFKCVVVAATTDASYREYLESLAFVALKRESRPSLLPVNPAAE